MRAEIYYRSVQQASGLAPIGRAVGDQRCRDCPGRAVVDGGRCGGWWSNPGQERGALGDQLQRWHGVELPRQRDGDDLHANTGGNAHHRGGPEQLAFDNAGNLWVAAYDDSKVLAFAASALTATGSPPR